MSFLFFVVAAVALAWAPLFLARGSMLLGATVFLVLANCFGLEFAAFDIGPINMSAERFFLLLLPVAYAVQRFRRRAEPKTMTAAEWTLAAFIGLLILSTFTHDRSPSPTTPPIVQHLINGYLIPLTLFWVVRQSKITERQLRGVYAGMVAFGTYLALTGICEALDLWAFVFPKYIANPEVGLHFGRARGPMVQAVTFGLTLAACVYCGWQLWRTAGRAGRLLLLALLPAALGAIFFCKTRSVWLGTALGTGVLMVTCLHGAWRTGAIATAAAAGLLVGATQFDRIVAFDRKDNTAAQTRESVESRGSFLYVSWQMFKDRPLLGFGFGQFPDAKLPYLSDRQTEMNLEIIRPWSHHNFYLSLLTELGLIGLALFAALLVLWARQGWVLWRDEKLPGWVRGQAALGLAVLATYAVQGVFHEMSFTARDHSLVFLFAGITSGLYAKAFAAAPGAIAAAAAGQRPVWLPALRRSHG